MTTDQRTTGLNDAIRTLANEKPMSTDRKNNIQFNLSWIMAAFIVAQSLGLLNFSHYMESLNLIPKISEKVDAISRRIDLQDAEIMRQAEEIKKIKEILVRAKLARLDLGKKEVTTAHYE